MPALTTTLVRVAVAVVVWHGPPIMTMAMAVAVA